MNSDFMRRSPDSKANDEILDTGSGLEGASEGNVAWLRRQPIQEGVILLGGVTIDHFRVRVAQSRYRDDLAPSFWSMAGILLSSGHLLTVPFDRFPVASRVPITNGVQRLKIGDFDDVGQFPNIAVLSFAKDMKEIESAALRIVHSRALLDLPSMLISWLSYTWATDSGSNPLRAGIGVPSAAFVEAAFAACNVEISPGQRTASSSPEAIWQAARWWSGFYEKVQQVEEKAIPPRGVYRVTQWAAAALGVRDDVEGTTIRPAEKPARARGGKRGRSRR